MKEVNLSSSQSLEEVKETRGLVRVCDTKGITLKEMCSKTCHDTYNHTGRIHNRDRHIIFTCTESVLRNDLCRILHNFCILDK
jgi:hypothetical protein